MPPVRMNVKKPMTHHKDETAAFLWVAMLFAALYLISNVMAVKVISIFGLFYFDAGTITFPFAYMLGDVLTEIWGFSAAKRVIWITFFCNILSSG